MCGIIGYHGLEKTSDILYSSLLKMEYRGYDSCGIALFKNNKVSIYKNIGRVSKLVTNNPITFDSLIGIGHNRWASCGEVSLRNAHPLKSFNKQFTLVHNGVVENVEYLKEKYFHDVIFNTDTDSEVIICLIEKFYHEDLLKTIFQVCKLIEGSYSLIIIDENDPNNLYCAKNKAPLIIGKKGFSTYVASDIQALHDSPLIYHMEDLTFAKIGKDIIIKDQFFNDKDIFFMPNLIENEPIKMKDESYMLKEIYEQQEVIQRLKAKYLIHNEVTFQDNIKNLLQDFDEVFLIGCGTSYHACLIAEEFFNKLNIPSRSYVGSEASINNLLLSKKPLIIVISQSGETHDLIKTVDLLSNYKNRILLITNEKHSSLAFKLDHVLLMEAQKEVAVASTKTYLASYLLLYFIYLYIKKEPLKQELDILYHAIGNAQSIDYTHIVEMIIKAKKIMLMGRGIDYKVALEGSLKLKEISYLPTEAYLSGELKHGTMALMDEETIVIGLMSNVNTINLMKGNIEEIKSRKANVYLLGCDKICDVFCVDISMLSPLLLVVYMQLISYYTAKALGNNVDFPRNLAKSVTV